MLVRLQKVVLPLALVLIILVFTAMLFVDGERLAWPPTLLITLNSLLTLYVLWNARQMRREARVHRRQSAMARVAPQAPAQAPAPAMVPVPVEPLPVVPAQPVAKVQEAGRAAAEALDLPSLGARQTNFPKPRLRVGVVLDDFSLEAFRPEWLQYELTPTNWQAKLDTVDFDLLFVESSWAGNHGVWRYKWVGASAPGDEAAGMVAAFKAKGVPTVFWNKEDPPHFEDFLRSAAMFDWVFTTDSECVPKYRNALGHDRVATLPFAAQPALHNPVAEVGLPRDREIAFGGMYFANKYPERRAQMDMLLPAAANYDLDIFSRHEGNGAYSFPPALQAHVRGALPYPKMVAAYKAYKILLNVNSVIDSPSMCARRIFEISACGGAVVTPPSAALQNFFSEGELSVVETADAARQEMRALLRSEEFRARRVHRAQRRIWNEHTYGHRVDEVVAQIGLEGHSSRVRRPRVAILCSTIRPQLLPTLFATVGSQTYQDVQLVLNLHGVDVEEELLGALAEEYGIEDVVTLRRGREVSLGACMNEMVDMADAEVIAKFDDDDYYGPEYLTDMVNAYLYSGADIVGKLATYVHFEGRSETILTSPNAQNRFTKFVRGATLVGRRELIAKLGFGDSNAGEDTSLLSRASDGGAKIYSADKYNYCVIRSASPEDHTWRPAEMALYSTGDLVGFGEYRSLVTV